MGIDEIDESYRREIEQADKVFVESINKKSDLKAAEKIYGESLKRARDKYSKLVEKNLGAEKKKKKPKKTEKRERTNPFKVKFEKFDVAWQERLKLNIGIFRFKIKLGRRKIRKLITPKIVFYYYVIFRIKIGRFYRKTRDAIINLIERVENFIVGVYNGLTDFSKKVYEKFLNLPELVINKIKNIKKKLKEKKGNGEEKKEETSLSQSK